MDLSKLSKSELIERVEKLELDLRANESSFSNTLKKYFDDEKIISKFGNEYSQLVSIIDLKGNYIEKNIALKSLFRKELGNKTIKSVFQISDPKYKIELEDFFEKLDKVVEANSILKIINQNKKSLFYNCYCYKFKSRTGENLAISVVEDITQDVITNAKLKQTAESYQNIFDSSDELISITNNKGIILNVNKALANFYGKPKSYFIGNTEDIFPESKFGDRKEIISRIKNCWKTGKPENFKQLSPSENGTVIPQDIYIYKGEYFGEEAVIAVARIKEEEFEYKKALEKSEQKYSSIVNAFPDLIFRLNKELVVLDCIANNEALLFTDIENIIGHKISYLPEKIYKTFVKKIAETIKTDKINTVNYSLPINDETVYFEARLNKINDNEVIAIVRDTTYINIAKQNEDRFEKILDTMNEGVIIVDDKEEIKYVNKRFCEILGFDAEELVGKISYDIIIPKSEQKIIKETSKVRKKGVKSNFEFKLKHKNGNLIWVHNSGTPYITKEYTGSIGVITDISERKEIENNQEETLKNINEIVYRLKIDDDPINTKVLYASEKMVDIIGYNANDFIKNPSIWEKCIHPEDIKQVEETTIKLFKEKKSGIRTYRFKHKSTGKYIWLEDKISFKTDENGRVIEQFGVFRDITDEKENVLELKKAHAKFKILFDSSKDAVLILKDNNIIDCNLGAIELFQKNKKTITNLELTDIVVDSYKSKSISSKIKNAQSGIPQKFEWQLKKSNNLIVETIINRLFLEGGTYLQVIIRDISEQKRIKEITEASEKSFRELFNNSSDMIFIIGKDGFFKDINKEVITFLGYSKKELLTMTTKDLSVPGQDKDFSSKAWNGRTQHFEWIAQSKKGKKIPIEIKLKKAVYFGEEVLIANARDITQRKKSEESIKTSEEKFRRLFSTANDAIFIMQNETFVDCNDQTLKMFDCKRNEIIGQPPYKFSPEKQPDGRNSMEKAMEKIMAAISGASQRFYWVHITKKGKEFEAEVSLNHFELNGEVFIQAIVRDISKRKQAERALIESESKFKSIADNAPVLIRMSNKDNQTTFLSSKFEKFIGLKNNNFKNEIWRNKIHPRERELVKDTHNQAFKSNLKFEISYRIKNYNNSYRWILETGIPHFNDYNNFIGFITASIDITDRKNAEEALKNEETLRKSNELFRNTLESINLAAISLDRKGNITFCNNHFSSIVKINKNNLLNKNWFELFSPKDKIKENQSIYFNNIKEGKISNSSGSNVILSNGNKIIFNWNNIFVRNENNEIIGVTSIGEDVTQNKKDELINEVYNNINKLSINVNNINDFYKKAHKELQRLFDIKNFYISIHDKENDEVTFPYFADETRPTDFIVESRPYKNSLTEHVINSNKNFIINENEFNDIIKEKNLKVKGKIAKQWIGIPLSVKDNTFGILVVQNYQNEDALSNTDVKLLTFISNQIALAIDKINSAELLQKSEFKFRNIFENLQDLYYRTDLEGNFQLVSPSILEFTGAPADFFIGRNIVDFYQNPSERDKMLKSILKEGYINNFQTTMKKPSGEEVTIQANIKLVYNSKNAPIGIEGMVRDITEMQIAQQKIKENEQKFRGIFESLQDIYFKTKIDGTLEIISPSILEIAGYEAEELINKNISKLFSNKSDFDNFFKEIKDKNHIKNYESKFLKKDGKSVNTIANIQVIRNSKNIPTHLEGTIRDISDIKQTEEDLRLFENIIQNNWDAVVFSNLNGEIRYLNEAANSLYGYKGIELVGENVDIFNSELTHNTDEIVNSIQTKGGWVGELKQIRKNGEIFDAFLSVQLILNKDGQPIGMASHSKDISDSKKEQKELINAKNIAESSLKVKEQFLANMSHELRTPMNGIIGISELLKDTELSNEQNDFINIIQKSSSNLLNILNDILDLSKIEAGKIEIIPSPTSLENLILKLISLFEYQIKHKNITLTYSIDKSIPSTILVDETRLIQILSNLISNAIKFTDKGGVHIEIKKFKIDGKQIKLLFKVNDTGVGIKEEEFGKLFSYFSQLDHSFTKEYKGTGLGLAISKELTVLMGGEIGIKSKIGTGSTFWFTIQTEKSENEIEKINDLQAINEQIIEPKNILIVDDNNTNLLVAEKLINKYCENTSTVNSGKKCLEILKNNRFDLIFMDIQMPEMDGIETLKEIRKLNIKSPVIAMTAYAMKDDKNKFIKLGFNDYLPKPINSNSIKSILNKWNTESEIDFNLNLKLSSKKENNALTQLEEIGGEEFVNEVLNDFDIETTQIIKALNEATLKNDYNALKSEFHTLKGSAGTIGLMMISDNCKKGEDYSKLQDLEKIKTIINELEKLFNIFRQEYIHKV